MRDGGLPKRGDSRRSGSGAEQTLTIERSSMTVVRSACYQQIRAYRVEQAGRGRVDAVAPAPPVSATAYPHARHDRLPAPLTGRGLFFTCSVSVRYIEGFCNTRRGFILQSNEQQHAMKETWHAAVEPWDKKPVQRNEAGSIGECAHERTRGLRYRKSSALDTDATKRSGGALCANNRAWFPLAFAIRRTRLGAGRSNPGKTRLGHRVQADARAEHFTVPARPPREASR
jgi:hypothetical protein